VATLVSFHAHPDDEVFTCAGTLAKAAADGHRVVLVTATRGEYGTVAEGVLGEGETVAERRSEELLAAARILGVSRVEFLDYRDSGMRGWEANGDEGSFLRADVDEAARRLAAILDQERADVLTFYDETGGTGHPDHVKAHQVGVRASEMAGTRRIYEVVIGRRQGQRLLALGAAMGLTDLLVDLEPDRFGTPDASITARVDVTEYLLLKRTAMAAHASQIFETSLFLSWPPEVFAEVWGEECFIRRDAGVNGLETSLFQEDR
jgi:LmbE family N-acetylglucosaminyl deacetylase